MKKISLLLLSLPFFAFGQKSTASFEAYASPTSTYYTKSIIDDQSKWGFQFGLRIVLPTKNQQLHGLAGVQITSFGSKYEKNNLTWGTQHNGTGGFDPDIPSGETIDAVSFHKDHYFVEIPLGLRYYIRQGKVSLFVQPALSPMLYLTTRHSSKYSLAGEPKTASVQHKQNPDFYSLNLFGSVGAGMEFSMSKKFKLQLMPQAGIQAFSITKESETEARYYSMGMQVGVSYQVGN